MGKNTKAPSYGNGKKKQAPSYGGGNADQGYFLQGEGVDQAAAAKREGGYNRDPRQDNRFNALSQQDQQKYYDGGMTQSKPPGMQGTIPQGEDFVGDNGQTRTNMGELSNDEWLKKMNIAQPSADETSLRTDIESAAPVDGDPVESRIQDVMQRQGKTREEAEAQNTS